MLLLQRLLRGAKHAIHQAGGDGAVLSGAVRISLRREGFPRRNSCRFLGAFTRQELLVGDGAASGADAGEDERPSGKTHDLDVSPRLALRERRIRDLFTAGAIAPTADHGHAFTFTHARVEPSGVATIARRFDDFPLTPQSSPHNDTSQGHASL